jgi:hypothetical protein
VARAVRSLFIDRNLVVAQSAVLHRLPYWSSLSGRITETRLSIANDLGDREHIDYPKRISDSTAVMSRHLSWYSDTGPCQK